MIAWLPALAAFPILAALYLGGSAIHIEGGEGARQLLGLALHCVAFVVAYALLRGVVATVVGPVLSMALALLGATILLPFLGRLAFRVVGVRVTGAGGRSGEAAA